MQNCLIHNLINLESGNLIILKCGIKNNTEVTLKLSSNVVGDSNDEKNFPHKLLLTNNSPANIKLSKTQVHK